MCILVSAYFGTGTSFYILVLFLSLSCHKAQLSTSSEKMNFTTDHLNQHFLSVADRVVQGISPTSVSPHSFITIATCINISAQYCL